MSRAVKADEVSVVEPTQPLRLARQSKDNGGEWDRNRSFIRIRFRRPTSAQLSMAVKAGEISVVKPTQPLRPARQSKDN